MMSLSILRQEGAGQFQHIGGLIFSIIDFAFRLARRRMTRGGKGHVTCVDKANVFTSMAFFRKVFDERAALNEDIGSAHHYVDATALDLVRTTAEASDADLDPTTLRYQMKSWGIERPAGGP